jgi:hypothetical protein
MDRLSHRWGCDRRGRAKSPYPPVLSQSTPLRGVTTCDLSQPVTLSRRVVVGPAQAGGLWGLG